MLLSSPGDGTRLPEGEGIRALASVEAGAGLTGVVAFFGRRTSLEVPVKLGDELPKVRVFTANAAEPVRRTPATDRTKAVRVFMVQL